MDNNSKSIYTILLTFFLICLGLFLLLDWPLLKEIEKNSADLVAAKNSVATLAMQSSETKNFKKDYEAYKQNFDKIDKMFVDPNNPVSFIEFIEELAASSKITSQITLPQRSAGAQTSTMVQLVSKGTFTNVVNFAEEIENGPYLVEIENLIIQGDSSKNSDGKNVINYGATRDVSATFTIKVFAKK